MRQQSGGHDVPIDKIRSRYTKSLINIAKFISLCDVCHIYDNTGKEPRRIFKKKRGYFSFWPTKIWTKEAISSLICYEGHNNK